MQTGCIFVLSCIILTYTEGQTSGVPKPEIVQVTPTAQGTYVHWRLNPSDIRVNTISVVYDGSDHSHESIELAGDVRETKLVLVRPCIEYTLKVIAKLGSQQQSSDTWTFTGITLSPMEPPTNLRVTQDLAGRHLHWDPPSEKRAIRNYRIFGRAEGDDEPRPIPVTYDRTQENLQSFHLDRDYSVWMTSENLCGISAVSETVMAPRFAVPPTPIITKVQPGSNTIVVEFTKGSEDALIDRFVLEYTTEAGELVSELFPPVQTRIELRRGITACHKYTINLYAENIAGRSVPATVTAFAQSEASQLPTKPDTPAVLENDGKLQVYWEINGPHLLFEHEVLYMSAGEAPRSAAVPGNMTQVELTDVKRCRMYTVRMRSRSECGWSEYSDEVELKIRPSDIPAQPENFNARGTGILCTFSWSAAGSSEILTEYELAIAEVNGYSNFYWIAPGATEFVIQNLGRNKDYTCVLWAKNACGWSEGATYQLSLNRDGSITNVT